MLGGVIAPLLSPERVREILDAPALDTVLDLVTEGRLHGIVVAPGVLRIREADLRRFLDARRLELQLPASGLTRVGGWTLPSGRAVEIFLGPPDQGIRHLRVYYDDINPLSESDQEDLEQRVLPDAADRIYRITGKRGWGIITGP